MQIRIFSVPSSVFKLRFPSKIPKISAQVKRRQLVCTSVCYSVWLLLNSFSELQIWLEYFSGKLGKCTLVNSCSIVHIHTICARMCFQLGVGGGGRLFFQTVDLFTATFTALQTLTAKEPSDNWPTSKKKQNWNIHSSLALCLHTVSKVYILALDFDSRVILAFRSPFSTLRISLKIKYFTKQNMFYRLDILHEFLISSF